MKTNSPHIKCPACNGSVKVKKRSNHSKYNVWGCTVCGIEYRKGDKVVLGFGINDPEGL